MATLIHPLALSGSRLSDGTVNAGGRVFLTRVGSANTRVTGYLDKDKSAAHTLSSGGYLLDAAGKIAVFVDEPCAVRVEDQDGAAVDEFSIEPTVSAGLVEVIGSGWTGIDQDTGQYVAGERTYLARVLSSLAASAGGVDGKYLAATGATGRLLKDAIGDFGISIKAYGAKGDGAADDTAAVQAAISLAASIGGMPVIIPTGTFLISSALAITTIAPVPVIGESRAGSILKNTNTGGKVFNWSGTQPYFSNFTISHSSASTVSAITTSNPGALHRMTITGHAIAWDGTADTDVYDLRATGTAATAGLVRPAGGGRFVGGVIDAGAGSGGMLCSGSADVRIFGTNLVGGGGYGLDVTGTSPIFAYGVKGSGTSGSVRLAATSAGFFHAGCKWDSVVTDGRTGAPVNYSFAADGNFTPLPSQADEIRVVASAAAVVTINNITAIGAGRPFTLICARTTAGAVTWTFDTKYVLSAAVAPANGNRVNLLLQYSPIDDKVYEIGRAATAN